MDQSQNDFKGACLLLHFSSHDIVIQFCNKTYEALSNLNDNHEIKRNKCNKVAVNMYSHYYKFLHNSDQNKENQSI